MSRSMCDGSERMRPIRRLLLLLGTRGPGLAETLRGLSSCGSVVVAGADPVWVARSDRDAAIGWETVSAANEEDLLTSLESQHRVSAFHGVLAVADDAVVLTAVVADRLGLPGIPPAAVLRFRDKLVQRQVLREAGLIVPRWVECGPTGPVEPDVVPFPAVLKPARGSGGTMIFVISDDAELRAVLAECYAGLKDLTAVDRSSSFLLEEVIYGATWHQDHRLAPYVSVETATVEGQHRHLAVTDRLPLLPPVLETGMCLPTVLRPEQVLRVLAVVDRGLDALGLSHGLSHTEVMLTTRGPVIIEVNARVGGALPYLFPVAGGPDLFAIAGECALGRLPDPVQFRGYAISVNLQHPLGARVEMVEGLQEMAQIPGVVAVLQLTGVGHTSTSAQDALAAVVIASAPTSDAALTLHAACTAAFRPRYSGPARPEHQRRTPDGVVHPDLDTSTYS